MAKKPSIPLPVKAGVDAAQQVVAKVLASPWFWLVVALVVILIVRKHGNRWWQRLATVDKGNYGGHQGMNQADKARVEQLAHDLFSAIDGLPAWSDRRPTLFATALGLNDTELRYLGTFYPQLAKGRALSEDVAGEWVPGYGSTKNQLIARLRQIAL